MTNKFNYWNLLWVIPAGIWGVLFGIYLFLAFITLGGLPFFIFHIASEHNLGWLAVANIGMMITLVLAAVWELARA